MISGRPQRARVYLHREGSRLIVATVHHNQDGICFEAEAPLSLTRWTDEELGDSVKLALEQSGIVTRDLRKLQQTDWPSFKAGGEPSLRAFQISFIPIEISGANEDNLVYTIEGTPANEEELTVRASVAAQASPAEFARLINRVYQACRDRRF